jgi:hypothetical protein
MADEAAEFWENFEKETGEKVEARSIGEYFKEGPGGIGIWGLAILTEKSFRFKFMPSENWLFSLLKRAEKSKPKEPPADIVIARDSILGLRIPKRSFMARILGPAFPRIAIHYGSLDGERDCHFTIDPTSGILQSLERLAAGLGSGSAAK